MGPRRAASLNEFAADRDSTKALNNGLRSVIVVECCPPRRSAFRWSRRRGASTDIATGPNWHGRHPSCDHSVSPLRLLGDRFFASGACADVHIDSGAVHRRDLAACGHRANRS
jgi:hypothetical protein